MACECQGSRSLLRRASQFCDWDKNKNTRRRAWQRWRKECLGKCEKLLSCTMLEEPLRMESSPKEILRHVWDSEGSEKGPHQWDQMWLYWPLLPQVKSCWGHSCRRGQNEQIHSNSFHPLTGIHSMRPVLDGPGGRDEEARVSAKTNCGSHPPLSWESRHIQHSLKAASVGSWIMTLLGFIPQVLVFWLRRQYLIHFSFPHVKVSDSESQRQPSAPFKLYLDQGTNKRNQEIYLCSFYLISGLAPVPRLEGNRPEPTKHHGYCATW